MSVRVYNRIVSRNAEATEKGNESRPTRLGENLREGVSAPFFAVVIF